MSVLIRYIACAMILIGVSGIGFEYASKLGRRKNWYEQMTEFLLLLQQEIRYGHYELEDCLRHVLPRINGFFSAFAQEIIDALSIADGTGMRDIWEQSIAAFQKLLDDYGCCDEETELLRRLGSFLGACGMEQQNEQIRGLLEAASQKKAALSEGLCGRQKAVRLLGICTGAFIVLALL